MHLTTKLCGIYRIRGAEPLLGSTQWSGWVGVGPSGNLSGLRAAVVGNV